MAQEKEEIYLEQKVRANENNKKGWVWAASLFVFFMAYAVFLHPHFSSDTYANLSQIDTAVHLQNGRLMTFAVQSVINMLGINVVGTQSLFTALLIATVSICTMIIFRELWMLQTEKSALNMALLFCAVHVIFINVFFAEWYLYVESFPSTIVGLFILTGAIVLSGKTCTAKTVLGSFVLLFIVLNMYQLYVSFFLILALTIVYIKHRGEFNKTSVVHSIIIVVEGAMSSLGNIFLMNMLKAIGVASNSSRDISLSLAAILKNAKEIWDSQIDILIAGKGLLPFGCLALYAFLLLAGLAVICVQVRCKIKNIVYFSGLLIAGIGITYAPHLLTETLWIAPRTIVGVFIILVSVTLVCQSLTQNSKIKKYLLLVSAIFMLINIYNIQGICINNIASYHLDQACAAQIDAKIAQYETETGDKVLYMGVVKDTNPSYSYTGIEYVVNDMNIRGLVVDWADVNLINFYTGASYQKVDVPEDVYTNYFEGKNWVGLDLDEQVVFVGDAVYLAMY